MIKQKPTSVHGYHARCYCCVNLVWVDTTDGYPPGPDLCSQECYDNYHASAKRLMPAWTED